MAWVHWTCNSACGEGVVKEEAGARRTGLGRQVWVVSGGFRSGTEKELALEGGGDFYGFMSMCA